MTNNQIISMLLRLTDNATSPIVGTELTNTAYELGYKTAITDAIDILNNQD